MSLNGHSADAATGVVVLHGALAASVTPLLQGGAAIDEDAFGPLVERYATAGLDGVLAFGTNGEGVLFSVAERQRGLRLFVEAAAGRLDVAAHCGAQTTADTVALAGDASEAGAAAVAVIGPPYFPLDEEAQLAHFAAAAAACDATAVLRLRVRADERLPDRARRAPTSPGCRPELRRPQGERCPLGGVRAVPHARSRRVRRARRS